MANMVRDLASVDVEREAVETDPRDANAYRITNRISKNVFTLTLLDTYQGAQAEMRFVHENTDYLVRCHGHTGLTKFVEDCIQLVGRD